MDISKTLWSFVKHKLIRLYPVLIFLAVCYFILSRFGGIKFAFYDNILALLYINGIGLSITSGNLGISWYVSTMLWVMAFYFYLLKNFSKKNVNLTIFIITFFCYCFILHARNGNIGGNFNTIGYIFNFAILRGLGGIGLGYLIGDWYRYNINKISTIDFPIKGKLAISIIEFMCLFFIINNLMLHRLKYKNHMIFIVAFGIIIFLFLIRRGYISKIFEINLWPNLSKYTYSFYMTHSFVMNSLNIYVWKSHRDFIYQYPILNVILTLILVILFGLLTYHCVEDPCTKYFKKKCKEGIISCQK